MFQDAPRSAAPPEMDDDAEDMDHATATAIVEDYFPSTVRLHGTRARSGAIHDLMGEYKLAAMTINKRPVWEFTGDYSDYAGDDKVLLYYGQWGWVVGSMEMMPNHWIIGIPRDFSDPKAKWSPLNASSFQVWDFRVPEGLPDPEDSADEMAQADLAENVWWSDSTLTCTRA